MRFTVLERTGVAAVLLWTTVNALAQDRAPVYLVDPTFQVKYDQRVVKFEPMPLAILQQCEQISGLPNITPVYFIYGRTVDAQGRTYYATGGYELRASASTSTKPKYHVGGLGLLFAIDGDECTEFGPIMETFTASDEEIHDMLSALAIDMAARYEKAFNGPKGLKQAFKKQAVKRNKYARELDAAFAPYYAK